MDDANNPQSMNFVFHITHSTVPRIPSLCKEYVSLIVNVVKSKTVEAARSRKLYMEKIKKKLFPLFGLKDPEEEILCNFL